jgi:hypothetical protein
MKKVMANEGDRQRQDHHPLHRPQIWKGKILEAK